MRKAKNTTTALDTEQGVPETDTEQPTVPEPLSLASLVHPVLSTLLSCENKQDVPDSLTQHITEIDTALASLVSDKHARAVILPQWQRAISTYLQSFHTSITEEIHQCQGQGKPLQKTAKTRLIRQGASLRKTCVSTMEKALQATNKEHKLKLVKGYTSWVIAIETISEELARLGDTLVTLLSLDIARQATHEHGPDTEQHVAPEPEPDTDTEPLVEPEPEYNAEETPDEERKRIALFREGYAQYTSGMHGIRKSTKNKLVTYKIVDAIIDIQARRCVFSVPNRVGQTPEPVGTVLVAEFTGTREPHGKQTIEIHRSDMLKKEPAFLSVIQSVALPHPRKRSDFIHVIDVLGQIAPVEHRYDATGLIETEKQRRFLQPTSGAITTGGFDATYQVQFNHRQNETLRRLGYGWHRASTHDEQIEDYRTLLQIRDVAPGSKGYGTLLLGIHAFCPMSQLCDTGGIHAIIHGVTGSYKSATSRLPLQGYATIHGRSETSTVNLADGKTTPFALEQLEYFLPGMFVHADDALKGRGVTEKDVKSFFTMMSIRARHSVERQGRDAGVWNGGAGGFSQSYYPRGSSVTTVEILPDAENFASDLARYAVVSLDGATCVDVPLLSRLQEPVAASAMNRVTASYIQWLLPRMEALLSTIQGREDAYRCLSVHVRIPTTYAKIETGIDALLQYGVSIGAITEIDAELQLEECKEHLAYLATMQNKLMGIDEKHQQANDAVELFYGLLRKLLRSGKLYATDAMYRTVKDVQGSTHMRPRPPIFLQEQEMLPDTWGWKFNESQGVEEPYAGGIEVGVLKHETGTPVSLHMYVRDFKDSIYPLIVKTGKDTSIPLPGLSEMIDKLKKANKLQSTTPTNLHGRNSVTGRCYILDMSYEPEPEPETSTETGTASDTEPLPEPIDLGDGNEEYNI